MAEAADEQTEELLELRGPIARPWRAATFFADCHGRDLAATLFADGHGRDLAATLLADSHGGDFAATFFADRHGREVARLAVVQGVRPK
ncbi:MAG TPA: hypothetical protein VLJ62_09185, partial [Burkholderiaceae bacterium]|nr:hypothetical protein [Burkholderiaceae bacterium]